jgi:hypothetical protein
LLDVELPNYRDPKKFKIKIKNKNFKFSQNKPISCIEMFNIELNAAKLLDTEVKIKSTYSNRCNVYICNGPKIDKDCL